MQITNPVVALRYYEDTYTQEGVNQLCIDCGFEPSDLSKLTERLEHAAAIYRWEKSKLAHQLTTSERRGELRRIEKEANRLKAALKDLSDDNQTAIEKYADKRSFAAVRNGGEISESDTWTIRYPMENGASEDAFLDLSTFMRLLVGLQDATTDAIADLGKTPPGKRKGYEISIWLSNIAKAWTKATDQPFSRDVASDGEPVTNAARFCVGAFQFVDPTVQRSAVLTGMKNKITQLRE